MIRHPAVAVSPHTCYGATDLPLAGPLAPDVAHLAPLLPADASLFSSPLSRARLLADALGEPELDPRLREIDFGDWEMQPFDAIGRDALDRWASDPLGHRPPGGESAAEMAARAHDFLDDLRRRQLPGPIVIVAHGGPLRAITGHLLGLPPDRWLALDFAHARLSQLTLSPWGATLRRFNL
nr:alpha-ribazole phosphatase family protein [Niveibacterium umoris]